MSQRRRMLCSLNQADKTNYFGTTTPTLMPGRLNDNGTYIATDDFKCLNYVEVEPSKTYTSEINLIYNKNYSNKKDAAIYQIAVYDTDKNFISFLLYNDITQKLNTRTFSIPENGRYIRMSYRRKTGNPLYGTFVTWYACGLYRGNKSYLQEEIS